MLLPFGSAQSSGRRMWAANRNVGAAAATALCGDDDDGNGVATVARILRAPNCAVAMCWRLCVCVRKSICICVCLYVYVFERASVCVCVFMCMSWG